MKKQFYLFIVASFILLPICRGESVVKTLKPQPPAKKNAAAPKQEEKIPDYSKGFAVFHKMGLPNVAKSEFGQLDVSINLIGNNDYSIFGYQQQNGNAWLLDGDPKTQARYLYDQSVIISVKSRKQAQDELKKKRKKKLRPEKKPAKKQNRKTGGKSYWLKWAIGTTNWSATSGKPILSRIIKIFWRTLKKHYPGNVMISIISIQAEFCFMRSNCMIKA